MNTNDDFTTICCNQTELLREKLIEIEERRQAGVADIAAWDLSAELGAMYFK